MARLFSFNSLSRDHGLSSLKPGIQRGAATFNSLSRDHRRRASRSCTSFLFPTFNSLSRDHVQVKEEKAVYIGFHDLSTPSLGITE